MASSLRRSSSTASTVVLSGSSSSLSSPEASPRPYRLKREHDWEGKIPRALKRKKEKANSRDSSQDTLILSPTSSQEFSFPDESTTKKRRTSSKTKSDKPTAAAEPKISTTHFGFAKKKGSIPKEIQNLKWTDWRNSYNLETKDKGAYLFEIAVKPKDESHRYVVYIGKFASGCAPDITNVSFVKISEYANKRLDYVKKNGCEIHIRNTTVLDITAKREKKQFGNPMAVYEPKLSKLYGMALDMFDYAWNEVEQKSHKGKLQRVTQTGLVL